MVRLVHNYCGQEIIHEQTCKLRILQLFAGRKLIIPSKISAIIQQDCNLVIQQSARLSVAIWLSMLKARWNRWEKKCFALHGLDARQRNLLKTSRASEERVLGIYYILLAKETSQSLQTRGKTQLGRDKSQEGIVEGKCEIFSCI